jgi:hypothetical protein
MRVTAHDCGVYHFETHVSNRYMQKEAGAFEADSSRPQTRLHVETVFRRFHAVFDVPLPRVTPKNQ